MKKYPMCIYTASYGTESSPVEMNWFFKKILFFKETFSLQWLIIGA
jgi:hypothetical protein